MIQMTQLICNDIIFTFRFQFGNCVTNYITHSPFNKQLTYILPVKAVTCKEEKQKVKSFYYCISIVFTPIKCIF